MPSDNVLALLALLFLWLFERLHRRRRSEESGGEGRRPVDVEGWEGVQVIEALPSRPLAFSPTVTIPDRPSSPGSDGPARTVDLSELSCSCPEFQSRRADLDEEAIGRVCAHVSRALRQTGVTSSYDALLRSVVESGATRRRYYEVPLRSDGRVAVGVDEDVELVDVVAPERGREQEESDAERFRRFRYSPELRRWEGDHRPAGAAEIAKFVDRVIAP